MQKAVAGVLTVTWLAFSALGCANLKGKERGVAIGATVGAAAGATIGATIGHDSHDSGEGAAIGGVLGAIIGGTLGGVLAREESPPSPPAEAKPATPPPSPPEEAKEEVPPAPAAERKEIPPPPPPPSPTPAAPPAEVREEAPPPPAEVKEVPPLPKQVVFSDLLFDFDKYSLKPTAYPILKEEVVDYLKANPSARLSIEGHTDSIGSKQYNQTLSQRRVHTVRKYLVSQGIAGERLDEQGFGETRPVSNNKTREGRRLNRRVEFKVSP